MMSPMIKRFLLLISVTLVSGILIFLLYDAQRQLQVQNKQPNPSQQENNNHLTLALNQD